MAIAGRRALVKVSGTAVAFTDEATTNVGGDLKTYQINATAKRVWDRTAAVTVKKNTVVQATTLYTVNRLTGTIVFNNVILITDTVTVSGQYLPMTTAAEAKEYAYNLQAQNQDDTEFSDTFITRKQGLKTITGSLSKWYVDGTFEGYLNNETPKVLELYSDSSGAFDVKAWVLLSKEGISAVVSGLVEESVDFEGITDIDGRTISG